SGPTLVLEALPDASVGVRSEASLVVTTSDRPDITGEASFEVGVRGARGALDVSFDGDGIRTDVPLDGSRDRVTHVALAPDGTIVVAGDGRADDRRVGFVSWYGPDGVPDRAIADGGSRVIDVLDEENVRTRGLLP
ncbi:MAG: hypothetical protein GWO04_26250, partial [Actinobacteria bacterium]|nr:hypothetical protein [Actinomycetota bacterium]